MLLQFGENLFRLFQQLLFGVLLLEGLDVGTKLFFLHNVMMLFDGFKKQ
jgi:hypothetical protein